MPLFRRFDVPNLFVVLDHAETLLELVNASAGIDEFLLTGEEGMALGADFDLQIAFGGASLNFLAASTLDGALFIFGMDLILHVENHGLRLLKAYLSWDFLSTIIFVAKYIISQLIPNCKGFLKICAKLHKKLDFCVQLW